MIVFNKGTEYTPKGRIPLGGQESPNSTLGETLLSKKAQKKEKKNRT